MLDLYGGRTRHYEKGLIVAMHPFGTRIESVSRVVFLVVRTKAEIEVCRIGRRTPG
jgi:hypothetical protein